MAKSSIGKIKKVYDDSGKENSSIGSNMKTVATDVNSMTKGLGDYEKFSYKPKSTTGSTQPSAPQTPISPSQKRTESQTVTQPTQQTIGLATGATESKETAATSSEWARGGETDMKVKSLEEQDEYIGSPIKSPAELEMEQIQKDKQRLEEEALAKGNQLDAYNQAQVLEQSKRDQEYMAKQKELTDRQQAISEEMQQTASSQRIRQAQNSLQNLKQNVGYLGQQGRPGKSLQALEGMTNMLAEGQRVYQELKQNEQYAEEMRRLGYEFDANAYEKEMENLQYRLDQQVTQSIQKIFDQMTADEIAGKLDTLEEVEELGARYYNMLDEDIASITRKEYDMAMLKLNRANESLTQVRKIVENKNKWEVHPSGYYVDGNGTPLVDTMGKPIQVPAEAPYEPVISADKSQMVTFGYDEAGNVVSTVHNLFDTAQAKTWENTTISNMAKAVDNGTLTISDALKFLPEGSQQQFFNMLGGQQAPGGGGWSTQEGMRTDRHNNPTAFTTDIAKQAGLVEGVDYERGDPFPNNPNMFTARLLGDPIQTSIDVIDKIGFYTQGGQQRRTHTAYSNEQRNSMTQEQKEQVIVDMYQKEGGSGVLAGDRVPTGTGGQPATQLSPVAQMVIDGEISVDQIKDNTATDREAQRVMQEVINYRQQQGTEGDASENAILIADVNELLGMSWREQKTSGRGFGFVGGDIARFDTVHKFVKEIQTFDNFLEAKANGATFGAMSKDEWDILRSTASKLDRRTSRKNYQGELVLIRAIMQGKSKKEAEKARDEFKRNYGKEEKNAMSGQQTVDQQVSQEAETFVSEYGF